MADPKAVGMSFEKHYDDGSGVEYGVYLQDGPWGGPVVRIEHVGDVQIEVEQIPWLMACLARVQMEGSDG